MDVGTDRESFWTDPTYMGLKHSRVRGAQFNEIIAEFFEAAQDAYGRTVLIQVLPWMNSQHSMHAFYLNLYCLVRRLWQYDSI